MYMPADTQITAISGHLCSAAIQTSSKSSRPPFPNSQQAIYPQVLEGSQRCQEVQVTHRDAEIPNSMVICLFSLVQKETTKLQACFHSTCLVLLRRNPVPGPELFAAVILLLKSRAEFCFPLPRMLS